MVIYKAHCSGTAPAFNQVAMMVVQIIMSVHPPWCLIYMVNLSLAVAGIINKVAMVFFSLSSNIPRDAVDSQFNYGAKNMIGLRRL